MTAVIYARYSCDKQREASIDDQIRNCDRFASQQNWAVSRIYKDEAISGASKQRQDFSAMLADAESKQFTVLLVDDLSRLSRDDVEMKQIIRRFRFAGLRIVGVSDGFDSDSKGHKIHAGVRGLINEIYLDDLREKTHRGLSGQALKGFNCGGRTYGYKNIPIEDAVQRDEYGRPRIIAVKKEIHPEEAAWVQQIYGWYADGYSPRWIANELNTQGVLSPRGSSWASSAIYGDMNKNTGILNNELYVGKYVWNRSEWTKDPDTGKRKRLIRADNDWIVNEMPELRIIEDTLWQRVKRRQQQQREKSVNMRAAIHVRARTGAGPKYLFSSMLKCGCCGSNYIVIDRYRYGCARYTDRGAVACSNSIKVPRQLLEQALLKGIKEQLFTAEGFALFQEEAKKLLEKKRKSKAGDNEALTKKLQKAEKEIENIMNAIKQGIITATTREELERSEQEKKRIQQELQQFSYQIVSLPEELPNAYARYQQIVENLETKVQSNIGEARNIVSQLLGGSIRLQPAENGELVAEMYGEYEGLVRLTTKSQLSLVAGARFGNFEPKAVVI